MNKIAENSEFWMGRDDETSRKTARSFLDKLTWLIDLCIHNENRVLELKGGNKKGKKSGEKGEGKKGDDEKGVEKKENEKDNFEELNLSEFDESRGWDAEDMKVVGEDEVPDE